MIEKITSHDLNDIMNKANNKLETIISEIKMAKSDINNKLKIMKYESEFLSGQMNEVKDLYKNSSEDNTASNDLVFALFNRELSSGFENYGSTITPAVKNSAAHVFNILATATGEAFYRDIAEVSINDIVKEEYKDILKHDTIKNKSIFFKEMDGIDPECKITITLDNTKALGLAMFNTIEFDMFFNGSYTIKEIKIHSGSGTEEYANYINVGRSRIVLDKEYVFSKVEMTIIPHFHTTVGSDEKSLIGIKHIYFCNSKFVNNGYIVSEIKSNNFIDIINDEISIKTHSGTINTTATHEGIEFYLNKSIDTTTNMPILLNKQDPSKPGEAKPITYNVKTIYAKIPLKNRSIIGTIFSINSKLF